MGERDAATRRATIDVDDDEETIEAYLRLSEGMGAALDPVVRAALQGAASAYRVSESPRRPDQARRELALRRGIGGGMTFAFWLDGPLLRVRVSLDGRLDTVWGLFAIACGLIAWLGGSVAFCAGMSPHAVITRYSWLVGAVLGVVTMLVVALVTWPPLRLATRRARRESFADARRIVDEVVDAIESQTAGPARSEPGTPPR